MRISLPFENSTLLDYIWNSPPPALIQPGEITVAVVTFAQDEAPASRVMVWPAGRPS